MKRALRLAGVVLVILLFALGAFVAWASIIPPPEGEALAALQTDAVVTVTSGEWLVFAPVGETPTAGFIFYPGGRVDARAYAPAARAIAAAGYRVVIVPMPLNLAVLAPDRAEAVMAAFPDVSVWAVGGHSLGGAMAARFAADHSEAVQGLALWAAYPAASDDLSALALRVVVVYGTRDGLANAQDVTAAAERLPADTRWVAVEGGNHAQFGWYGPQSGDNPATVSAEAQQAAVVAGTVEMLAAIAAR